MSRRNTEGATITLTSDTLSKTVKTSKTMVVLVGYLLVTMICGGATCARGRRGGLPEFNPPPVFTGGTPTLSEIVEKTNRSLQVSSLASNSLTIASPDLPFTLDGNFRWERKNNFRLETKKLSSAFGTPLAAGSNENMFWLQSSRPTPTIFYARHNEFENQQGGRHVLPVSPLWLREAFGIVELDPQGQHEGPTVRADGKLEIVSYIPSPRGDYRRKLTMSPSTGTIEETTLYDHTGKLIAIAKMSKHQYYAAIDWSLPHEVQIQLLPDFGDPINFSVQVAFYQTNDQAPPNSFVFPDTTGLTAVDLVRVNESIQREANGYQNPSNQSQSSAFVEPYPANQTAPYPTNPNQPSAAPPGSNYSPASQLPWQVQPNQPANTPDLSAQRSGITNPIYRTASQPASQPWQGNLRR